MKNFLRTTLFLLCSFWLTASGHAQLAFGDHTAAFLGNTPTYSGIAVAVADMNGDGLDDAIRLHQGTTLRIAYQVDGGEPFLHTDHGNLPGDAWAIAVGDVDNDGFADILAGGFYDGMKVLSSGGSPDSYTQQILPGNSIFAQGSNLADINNDGWLDVFACHDDGESRIWGNDGAGGFFQADGWIDMATVPASDNSGNYGSVWTDFDNDGDIDLYIAKCRQGVSDPEDPRRINALFVNDGQGNFIEAAAEYGLQIKWQSWTADFQDIDNDGDMDALITNHDFPLQLLENDGSGHFTDISESAGIAVNGGFLQGIMRDFDNDGFMDILTADPTYLFRNNGDKTFSPQVGPLVNSNPGTIACGDLNHDGFQDVYAGYACGITSPCNIPDKLWLNDGNGNHFLSVRLQGVQSNRAGIGARIELHGSWGIQVREVRSGESYGIMNASSQHFGLGADTLADFLVVRWPSGTVDVFPNPAADQFLTLVEGNSCTGPGFSLLPDNMAVLCPDDSLVLAAPPAMAYLWQNGTTEQTLTVTGAGTYRVITIDSNGCANHSEPVSVALNPDETPTVSVEGETVFCRGGTVTLTASAAAAYAWSNGETTQSVDITESGSYLVTVPGACGDFSSATVEVIVEEATPPAVQDTVLQAPALVALTAAGNAPVWYDSLLSVTPLFAGDTFLTPLIEADRTFYVEDRLAFGGGTATTGMAAHQGTPYSSSTFNGQLLFDALDDFILREVTVQTDQAGTRWIELTDNVGNVLQTVEVDLPTGVSVLTMDMPVPAGNDYVLTTNAAVNQATLGTVTPRLRRSDQGVTYPYLVDEVVSIKGSNFGSGYYYYFYDWQVELPSLECTSERVPVTVFLQPTATADPSPGTGPAMTARPNPGDGNFLIDHCPAAASAYRVFDPRGRTVRTGTLPGRTDSRIPWGLDLTDLPAGCYFLQVTHPGGVATDRLVVTR
jgi:hypothetical protein